MTVCDRGRGVKNHQKKRDILYGRPHMPLLVYFLVVYVILLPAEVVLLLPAEVVLCCQSEYAITTFKKRVVLNCVN